MNGNRFVIITIILLVLFACKSENTKDDIRDEEIPVPEQQSNPNELTIYTIPSPVLVSNTLKLFNIEFNNELLNIPERNPNQMISNYSKALNLGKCIVDLAYTSVFNQTQHSIIYLNNIEKLLDDLNISNHETIFAIEKFKSNLSNPDSLSQMIVDFQNKLNDYYYDEGNDELSLLVVSGIYIEGLYIALNYHEDIIRNHFNDHLSQANGFKNLIFQQKIYLESLSDLMSSIQDESNKQLIDYYQKLAEQFDKMEFDYTLNIETNKIEKITYKRSEIDHLKDLVQEIRNYIINA